MNSCTHKYLDLLPPQQPKLRCRHCHLIIREKELVHGACPECLEVSSKRRTDFEQLPIQKEEITRYRCEECGFIIECA